MDLVELALAHRAGLIAEIDRLDAFLDKAAALIGDLPAGDEAVAGGGAAGANVLPFRREFSAAPPDPTTCETGA